MKLWLISQSTNNGYDTYDSAIVAAETAEDARRLHPDGDVWVVDTGWVDPETRKPAWQSGTWATPGNVKAALVGEAVEGTKAGIILASFNAG